jgi:hypothetical protein
LARERIQLHSVVPSRKAGPESHLAIFPGKSARSGVCLEVVVWREETSDVNSKQG